MQEFSNTHLWKSRGYLPHYHADEKYQMIAYRLADSIPQKLMKEFKEEYNNKELVHERRKFIEENLDKGYGSCILQNPIIAEILVNNWLHFHRKRYDLKSFVVMPNHIHLLIKVYPENSLSKIVHSWKSYTSNMIKGIISNTLPGNSTKIWQAEYWDRFIRDDKHFHSSVNYIHSNPSKAGLVSSPELWQWSSANAKYESRLAVCGPGKS